MVLAVTIARSNYETAQLFIASEAIVDWTYAHFVRIPQEKVDKCL